MDRSGQRSTDDSIEHINDYALSLAMAGAPMLRGDERLCRALASTAYEMALTLVEGAGFQHAEQLSVSVNVEESAEHGNISIVYNDDEYAFSLIITSTMIQIRKPGCRLSTFEDWYFKFMPWVQSFVEGVLAVLGRELNDGTYSPDSEYPKLVTASHYFRFIFYNVYETGLNSQPRNALASSKFLATKYLKFVPSEDGCRPPEDVSFQFAGRVDVKYSFYRRYPTIGQLREIYNVETPGNIKGKSFWMSFVLSGETFYDPDAEIRVPFEPPLLLANYEEVFREFLSQRCLDGFAKYMLEGHEASTTHGSLP